MKVIESRAWEIKKELADRVKHQFRRIPVLHFYHDDTLDYVFKMEEIFKQINAEKKATENKDLSAGATSAETDDQETN
jgi:ribosome-binding factor A